MIKIFIRKTFCPDSLKGLLMFDNMSFAKPVDNFFYIYIEGPEKAKRIRVLLATLNYSMHKKFVS